MSNSHKGEFVAVIGGTSYRFKMGTSAMVELQEFLSPPGQVMPIEEILRDVMRMRLRYVQAFLWAGLRRYHADVTMEQLADALDESDEKDIQDLLAKLGMTTAPDPKDLDALKVAGVKRPRTARAKRRGGTGATSTSTPAVSA